WLIGSSNPSSSPAPGQIASSRDLRPVEPLLPALATIVHRGCMHAFRGGLRALLDLQLYANDVFNRPYPHQLSCLAGKSSDRLTESQPCPCCGGQMDAIDEVREGRIRLRCRQCGMSEVRLT